jgi:hypothetical protein
MKITDEAKATLLRILIQNGPQPSANFEHGRLQTLQSCLATCLVIWVRHAAVPTVCVSKRAAPWLTRRAARMRMAAVTAQTSAKRAHEALASRYGGDTKLAQAIAEATAGWVPISSASRVLHRREAKSSKLEAKARSSKLEGSKVRRFEVKT